MSKILEEGRTEKGYGPPGLILPSETGSIFSISKEDKGFWFMEECDGYFAKFFTKEEALQILDELKDYINK